METQIEEIIQVASDPRSDQSLQARAYEYLDQVRTQREGWSTCFRLAIRKEPPSEVVRLVCLDILNNAIKTRQLSNEDLMAVSGSLFTYIKRIYGGGPTSSVPLDPVAIQNKITQTMTYLFAATYEASWPTFFHDIEALRTASGSSPGKNGPGTIMYLRILIAVHDEIADVIILKSPDEQKSDMLLKDLIRERDIKSISASWHDILAQWHGEEDAVIELCLACIGRWVAWTDISLAVNDTLLTLLFELLSPHLSGDQGPKTQEKREAAMETFLDILGKKMGPSDKLDLIDAVKVDQVITQLVNGRSLSQQRGTPEYDTDLAEEVAKLVNNTVADIVKAIEASKDDAHLHRHGVEKIKQFMPHVLRFLSDEYDEICWTVIPCITDFLALVRKQGKGDPEFMVESSYMLPLILDAVISKVKYDETADWGNEDTQTDEAEFSELRKRLHVLQEAIAAVDDRMYIEKLTTVVISTCDAFQNRNGNVDWRDLELALYEMYQFGGLAMKHGGLYSKTKPVTPAAEQLIRMLYKMMETNIPSASHPAIHLQFMELCVRYNMFFEANPQFISRVLEYFVSFVHHDHPKVKLRSWYLLQRFVRHVRLHIGDIAQTVIGALGDLLPIKAEVPDEHPDDFDEDGSSSTDGQSANARFTSQLYLYETIGCVLAAKAVPINNQVLLLRTVMNPLFSDMETNLEAAKSGHRQARLQIHHLIMALGTIARGFSDWIPSQTVNGTPPASEIAQEFSRAEEAILVTLQQVKNSFEIREAGRFAFSRLIGVLGSLILLRLPRWIECLLTIDSTRDEIALFMRLLDQIVFGFKTEIYDILNGLLTPLLQQVFRGISDTATGTDDEIQLAELKREFLAFLTVILNNNLEPVLVSDINQSIFGVIISTMEHLARDTNDYPTAKLTLSVLGRMVLTWGGPDVYQMNGDHRAGSAPDGESKAKLPGFDQFMISRFSPLSWAIPSSSTFDHNDAQSRQLLNEAASLQKTIHRKTGDEYLKYLRNVELSGMGMDPTTIGHYLTALSEMDLKSFQQFFKDLFQRAAK